METRERRYGGFPAAELERMIKAQKKTFAGDVMEWRIIGDLLARVEELEKGGRWIKVSERLPEVFRSHTWEESNPVLSWDGERRRIVRLESYGPGAQKWASVNGGYEIGVTHWMEMPEPPSGEEGGE